MPLSAVQVFLIVTIGALVGMLLGGLFGVAAGALAPSLFSLMIPTDALEPIASAVVIGATAGVLLGGGLAAFGLVVQVITRNPRGEKTVAERD